MKQRLISERLLYCGKATQPWICHSCRKPQPQDAMGYYYNIAHPCEPGRTICEPCVDLLCLRLEGKRAPVPIPAGQTGDLFRGGFPWGHQ